MSGSVYLIIYTNIYHRVNNSVLLMGLNRWVAEYQIDGFHFHSLSSMMYTHNGFASFTGDLEE